ncbi:MAG: hypothetical protein ABIA83_01685 [Patescibacteria group bacterium]
MAKRKRGKKSPESKPTGEAQEVVVSAPTAEDLEAQAVQAAIVEDQRAELARDGEEAKAHDLSLAQEIREAVKERGGEDLDVTAVADVASATLNPSEARVPLHKVDRPVTDANTGEWKTEKPKEYIPIDKEDVTAEIPEGEDLEATTPTVIDSGRAEDLEANTPTIIESGDGEDIEGVVPAPPVEEGSDNGDEVGEPVTPGEEVGAEAGGESGGEEVEGSPTPAGPETRSAIAGAVAGVAAAEILGAGSETGGPEVEVGDATPEVGTPTPERRPSATNEVNRVLKSGVEKVEGVVVDLANETAGTARELWTGQRSEAPSAIRGGEKMFVNAVEETIPNVAKSVGRFGVRTAFFTPIIGTYIGVKTIQYGVKYGYRAAKFSLKALSFGLQWMKNELVSAGMQLIGQKETVFGETPKPNIELLRDFKDKIADEKKSREQLKKEKDEALKKYKESLRKMRPEKRSKEEARLSADEQKDAEIIGAFGELGLKPDATRVEVNKAYKEQFTKAQVSGSTQDMDRLNIAYTLLKDKFEA